MSKTMNAGDLESIVELVTTVSNECGSYILSAILTRAEGFANDVAVTQEDFLSLLRHCRPRVVYLHAEIFDASHHALQYVGADDEEAEAVATRPDVNSLIRQMSRYNGRLCLLLAHIVIDGVMHRMFQQTAWFNEFENRAEAIEQSLNANRERDRNRLEATRAARTRDFAAKLRGHPKFNDGRPSREKRTYLATSLFPDLDRSEIYRIVEEATNMDWLGGS